MAGTDFYIYIVISLLGVAYPLLLQVIARLDEKYSSDNIVELFDRELEGKAFRYLLYASLIFIVIWTFKFTPIIQIDALSLFIDNSAAILLAVSTVALVIVFFFFVRKIITYYTPSKFIQYLRAKHSESYEDFKYFEALSDILLLSIKNQQRNIALTLSEFFYTAFRLEREKFKGEPVVYPDTYYDLVHKSIEELAILKEKRNYSLEYRTAGGIWLLGELPGSGISEKTYAWMWRNLRTIVRYQQGDMIVYHWETAHQFYTYNLRYIHEDYDYSTENFQVSNQTDVDKRKLERHQFIEFHYALGGLLTYKKMYSCIKRIFNHTNSQPPKYELLPESMYEIFKFYFDVRDPYDRKYTWISNQYPFPDQSGLNADYVIKRWISSYMALMFLRQYTLIPYLITMRPLEYPSIPATQSEIKEWIDGLDFFKRLVQEHLDNSELLHELNLDFLTSEWCITNDKPYPINFIDTFKSNLSAAYKNNALTLSISADKVSLFETSTQAIVEAAITEYQALNNVTSIDEESEKWYVNGQRMLQSKDAFSEKPEVYHIDFDSFLASVVVKGIEDGIASTFLFKKSKAYLLKADDIFLAIDRLQINDQYNIVCFGFNLEHFVNNIKVSGLTVQKYRDTPILSFNGSRLVGPSIFILRKADLPVISTKPISVEQREKYSLKKVSDTIELYTSVIDINNTKAEILEENKQDKEEDELRKSALLSICISTEIRWKKSVELIQIIQHSEYRQKGLPNSLNEVESLEK